MTSAQSNRGSISLRVFMTRSIWAAHTPPPSLRYRLNSYAAPSAAPHHDIAQGRCTHRTSGRKPRSEPLPAGMVEVLAVLVQGVHHLAGAGARALLRLALHRLDALEDLLEDHVQVRVGIRRELAVLHDVAHLRLDL